VTSRTRYGERGRTRYGEQGHTEYTPEERHIHVKLTNCMRMLRKEFPRISPQGRSLIQPCDKEAC
jgi:hypothetical protein